MTLPAGPAPDFQSSRTPRTPTMDQLRGELANAPLAPPTQDP